MMKYFVAICLLILFPQLNQAQSLSCGQIYKEGKSKKQAMEPLFRESFGDPLLFKPTACAGNVGRLLEKLQAAEDLGQFQVLFVLYEKGRSSGIPTHLKLRPHGLRSGFNIWNFHALLYSQGQILDLHSSPEFISTKEYFSTHFPSANESSKFDNLVLRLFSASEYLSAFKQSKADFPNDYDQAIARRYLKIPIEENTPLMSVTELLAAEKFPTP